MEVFFAISSTTVVVTIVSIWSGLCMTWNRFVFAIILETLKGL
jgi:hypothetical protein